MACRALAKGALEQLVDPSEKTDRLDTSSRIFHYLCLFPATRCNSLPVISFLRSRDGPRESSVGRDLFPS